MAQIPPIDDAYINEIIKSNGPYNPALLTTQGVKMRELIKLLRDRMEQGDAEAVHKTGDESISGTKTFTLIKAEGLSVNNLANPSLDTVISPLTGVQTKLLNLSEGTFGVQLSASVLAASRSQLLQDKDGVIALTEDLSDFLTVSQFDEELALKIDNTARGVAGGVSTLDSGGKIPASQLPDSVLGALIYQGAWDATTNTPALVNPPASSTKGYFYVTDVAGTQFGLTFGVGDWIVSNGAEWQKVDNTDAVTTVFGRLGNVLANEADYSTFYPLLSGNYANPSWLTSLDYSKITGVPNLTVYELLANKQNTLNPDGTGTKYPTVDAVNTGFASKQNSLVSGTNIRTINGNALLGSGNIAIASGVTTMAAIGTFGNANGATISGSTLTLQPADAGNGGVLTTGIQTIAGAKTFSSDLVINNVRVGKGGGSVNTNTAVGGAALNSNTTGSSNTAIGTAALVNNTIGINNTAVGASALVANTTGSDNTAIGRMALDILSTGNNNTALGADALGSNTVSSNNTAIGALALILANGTSSEAHSNTAMGSSAMYNTRTGIANTAIGFQGLYNNTTGSFNTAIGESSLFSNTTGINNVAIGRNSLSNNVSGSENTAIGAYTSFATSALTNSTALGANAQVTASNQIQLGNTSVTLVKTSGAYQGSQFRLSALNTAPASATDSGTVGEIRITSTFIYVCTATNTWVRSALTTW